MAWCREVNHFWTFLFCFFWFIELHFVVVQTIVFRTHTALQRMTWISPMSSSHAWTPADSSCMCLSVQGSMLIQKLPGPRFCISSWLCLPSVGFGSGAQRRMPARRLPDASLSSPERSNLTALNWPCVCVAVIFPVLTLTPPPPAFMSGQADSGALQTRMIVCPKTSLKYLGLSWLLP